MFNSSGYRPLPAEEDKCEQKCLIDDCSSEGTGTPQVVVVTDFSHHQQLGPIMVNQAQLSESNFFSALLFGFGLLFPVLWCIGSFVPVRSSFDNSFRKINRVLSSLMVLTAIVIIVIFIVAAIMGELTFASQSRSFWSNYGLKHKFY
jgi:hypothetical protein